MASPFPTRLCLDCGKPVSKERVARNRRKCYRCEVKGKHDQRRASHDRRVTMNGFTAEDYWRLYEAQGGHCAVYNCRANGATKFLSVDHDHNSDCKHNPKEWCRKCARGLLCTHHNSEFGKAKDNPLVFDSMAAYLRNPPAREVLK